MRRIAAIGLLLAVSAGAVTASAAQPTPTTAGVGHAGGQDLASVRVERQIAQLHRQLAITEAQAAPWEAFTRVMRENAQHIDTLYKQRLSDAAARTAPEDMASYAALARAHGEDVARLVQPFDDLYATMSDAQKKTADNLFRRAEGRQATRAHRG